MLESNSALPYETAVEDYSTELLDSMTHRDSYVAHHASWVSSSMSEKFVMVTLPWGNSATMLSRPPKASM